MLSMSFLKRFIELTKLKKPKVNPIEQTDDSLALSVILVLTLLYGSENSGMI